MKYLKKLIIVFFIIPLIGFSQTSTATLTNASGTSANVNINVGGSTTLRVTFTGTGPWNFSLHDGFISKYFTATTSPYIINITPQSTRRYSLGNLSTNTQIGTTAGVINVTVGTTPTLTFDTPLTLNACPGGTLEIPFIKSGTWESNAEINVKLVTTSGGFISSSISQRFQTSPAIIYIPTDLVAGTYKISMNSNRPYINSILSTFSVNVTANNCQNIKTKIYQFGSRNISQYDNTEGCTVFSLQATPQGSADYQYNWYLNGNFLGSQNGSSQASTYVGYGNQGAGNYTVNVVNNVTGYNQTSDPFVVPSGYNYFNINAPYTVICGANTSATMSSPITCSGCQYQWFKRNTNSGANIPIIGANSSSFVANAAGLYKLEVYDGECLFTGFKTITSVPTASISSTVVTPLQIGQSRTLDITLEGTPPFNFQLVGSDNSVSNHTTNINQASVVVSPIQLTRYWVRNISNACGAGVDSSPFRVFVGTSPTFSVTGTNQAQTEGKNKDSKSRNNSNNTNICPGSTVSVAYQISGTWDNYREMTVELLNSTTNALIPNTTQTKFNTNPILYQVPEGVPAGTYKVRLTSTQPAISASVTSSTTFTVTNTACAAPLATLKATQSCSRVQLSALPVGDGYSYQWLKNGTPISNATESTFNATENGNYVVNITHDASSYNSSATYSVAITELNPTITASSGQICGSGGSLTFTSSNTGGGITHQGYYSLDNTVFSEISGATSNTHTTTNSGYYYDIVKSITCETKSYVLNTCLASVNIPSKTVCSNASLNVPFTFSGGENQSLILQIIDATTTAVIVPNLLTLTSTSSTNYNPTVTMPSSLAFGNYKFKLISVIPNNIISIGLGIITVSGQTGGTPPNVTATPNTVTNAQNVSLSALGCQYDTKWEGSNGLIATNASTSSLVSQNTTFSAFCIDVVTGCVTTASNITVNYSCTDAYEPNNTTTAATTINLNSFVSPIICLNGFDNPDFFAWQNNGKTYYIKASLISSQVPAGNYKIGLSLNGTNLIVETLPSTIGQFLDTYLTLFDSDGISILATNDNGNANGFSKLVFGGISSCQNAVSLSSTNSPTDDYSNGTIIKVANATTGVITATNKITNTANVTYRAGKSIQLDPGFKADNGVVFKTEFGGCN